MKSFKDYPSEIRFVHIKESDPYKAGLAHGKLLKKEIQATLDEAKNFGKSRLGSVIYTLLFNYFLIKANQLKNKFSQSYQDEMRGIAVGSGQDIKIIYLINTIYEQLTILPIFRLIFGCSSFLTRLESQESIVVGKTTDLAGPIKLIELLTNLRTVFVYSRQVAPRSNFITLAFPGCLVADVVLRQDGQAFFVNDGGFFHQRTNFKYLPITCLLKSLTESTDISHSLKIIQRNHLMKPFVFLATDGTAKNSYLIETCQEACFIKKYLSCPLFNTNYFKSKKMRRKCYKKKYFNLNECYEDTFIGGCLRRNERIKSEIDRVRKLEDVIEVLKLHGPTFDMDCEGSVSNTRTVQGIIYLPPDRFFLPTGSKVPITYHGQWKEFVISEIFNR